MKININLFTFVLSLISIPLFLLTFTRKINNYFINTFGIHPLNFILFLSLLMLLLAIAGLKNLNSWRAFIRFIITIVITIIISCVCIFILIIGNIFS